MNLHITERNHAHRLPNAKTDSGSNTTVKTLNTVVGVDVVERLANSQVLGAVRVDGLGLHLDTDDLDRLVPCGQTTTERGSGDLLHHGELLAALLVPHFANTVLGNAGQTEARTPVGDLAHSDGIDATVDTADTLLAVDAHERLKGARRLYTTGRDLVLCNLHGLHARAEAHGGIGLCETTDHTSRDTGDEIGSAERLGVEFGFRSDEEEDGALGGGFNPGPRNETLVDCTLHELASELVDLVLLLLMELVVRCYLGSWELEIRHAQLAADAVS